MRVQLPTTPEENLNRIAPSPAAPRRKGAGTTREWLVVSDSGQSHLEEVGKHSIMRRTGLPARDLRMLDPLLSYPSTILGRERAIVVNLEHIKAIITATEVLVLNSKNPSVAPFVQDLQYRVSNSQGAPPRANENSDTDMELSNDTAWGFPPFSSQNDSAVAHEMKDPGPRPTVDVPKAGGPNVLPFEFRALEVCLESACRCLEAETSTLEQEAYPALDELTSKVSTLNLERVRQIKSRLVAISGRVQKVRDELEHLLDDDMDMAEMYLTEKLIHQQFEETSSRDELENNASELDDERDEDYKSENKSNNENVSNLKPNIEELEMLLEAYFVQIESTSHKLSTGMSVLRTCIFCGDFEESVEHLSLRRHLACEIWATFLVGFGVSGCLDELCAQVLAGWQGVPLYDNLEILWKALPSAIFWGIWKERHRRMP